ncbi:MULTISPECIES: hypothetical protein [Flavobacterium]|uniref:hypothetical protein n=1 Tax=Flavobacterium TaxID=237 RepID=UPI0011842AFC|nr:MULTISPECIES: hypothetical protein [Flavobacterium]MCR4033577.1 hypothetical protein [Flavobacterium panacis]
MKKILAIIIFGVLLSSCKKTEPASSDKKEIKNDSITTENLPQNSETDSEALLASFSKKRLEVIQKLKTLSAEEADALYEKYSSENSSLLHAIMEKENTLLEKFYNEDEKDKEAVKLFGKELVKHQLNYDEIGEGIVEITTKNDFYYTIFKDYVTSDYKDYLYLISEENKMTYSSDAALVISFKDLGDRIISWENFMTKYPNSKLIPSVKEQYKFYQLDYLFGQDNTPTVERANELYIYPENILEFDRFEKKYPKSPTVPLIHLFRENFKNENVSRLITDEQEKL